MGNSHRAGQPGQAAPEAQPEQRHPAVPGIADGADLAVDAADAETTRDEDAVHVVEHRRGTRVGLAVVGGDPAHLDLGPVREATRADRLGH